MAAYKPLTLRLFDLRKVEVKNRIRKEFVEADIERLANSIRDNGLIHPLTVWTIPKGMPRIVAGERRMRAILSIQKSYMFNGQEIPQGYAPVVVLGKDTTHSTLLRLSLIHI